MVLFTDELRHEDCATMSSVVSPVCLLGGLRLPGLPQRSTPATTSARTVGNEAQRLTLGHSGQYGASNRQISSLAFVASFRSSAGGEPAREFVRPDMLDSVDETDGFTPVAATDLEEFDMAKLDTMKLSRNQNQSSARSALEQASFMTNESLEKGSTKQQQGKQNGKGRFGRFGL